MKRPAVMDHAQYHPTVSNATLAAPGDHRERRPSVNITPIERVGRIAIGLAALVAGLVLIVSAGSALAVIIELLLIAAGLDLLVTGAIGHCPLYQRLGNTSPSLAGHH